MNLSLNCFILGDDPERIFPVEIPKAKNVGNLKDMIKEKKASRLKDVDASDLDLWQVSFPIGDLEMGLENIDFAGRTKLSPPSKTVTTFFIDVAVDDLHVIVKVPEVQTAVSLGSTELLSLNCFILGDNPDRTFTVKIQKAENVSILKDMIKEKNPSSLGHVDARNLDLFSVSIAMDDNPEERFQALNFEKLGALKSLLPLSQLFSELAINHIHVVIDHPRAQPDVSGHHPAEQAHRKIIQDAKSALAPSSVSGSARVFKSEQDKRPVYNGRPANLKGPPLSIYHPAFAEIGDSLQNLDSLVDPQEQQRAGNIAKLCQAAANIYTTKAERLHAVYPFLQILLGVSITANVDRTKDGWKTTEIDGVVEQDIANSGKKGIAGHFEVKNELGVSGQSAVQNTLSLRKRLIQPQYDGIRNTTCCPCITISVAGPYISFGGAIFVDIFVTEQFTDFIYLGGTRKKMLNLSRIFATFARGIEILMRYYHVLELWPLGQPNLARLFPHPTYFPGKYPLSPTPVFSGRFDYKGRDLGNYHRSIFEATYNNATVLVKFCESYHGKAHEALAEAEYAPNLFFCEKLRGGVMMVIMELIDGEDAFHHFLGEDLPDDILSQVELAVRILHDQNLVFGDLRRPNIVIKEKENKELSALLIDFDWVGTADQARYPPSLNNSGEIAWADGVCAYGLMRKDHDLAMLHLLNSSVKIL